ncbi:hypothetical protein TNIN_333801 [Trichonephila inaurata madagascariensis]|uniref:Uncharacterized protein n=1 Tax=Trichonephila inaurata madagascariensis TaxID=2747483 RepID=A0A8X7CG70_9ARAC|nr:hypothetical protein TNIN_333801 [Trichonephila inaurata madagascariensis]
MTLRLPPRRLNVSFLRLSRGLRALHTSCGSLSADDTRSILLGRSFAEEQWDLTGRARRGVKLYTNISDSKNLQEKKM